MGKLEKLRDTQWSKASLELRDSARRATDHINQMMSDAGGWWNIRHKYCAIRLSDGSCDGIVYDKHSEAVKAMGANHNWYYYLGFRNLASGANEREMAIVLNFQRKAYDAGMRLTDPDDYNGGREMLNTAAQMDWQKANFAAEYPALASARMKLI